MINLNKILGDRISLIEIRGNVLLNIINIVKQIKLKFK